MVPSEARILDLMPATNRLPVKPEVLSPAGSPEALEAALHAGADAVYLGVTDYNARVRATNFTLEELPSVLAEVHRWGVRAYITFNTLVFLEEESGAKRALEAIARAGADALIVQDLGVVRWIREIAPDLPVHASTQMTVTSADGIAPLERLGVRRVILGRELTIPEIARIREATQMELEVFVHGALCVSYSGQCLSSEAWGGRSANRGQCAQACRLPYDLLVDDRLHDLGDRAYLLSPRDLEGYRRIPELTAVGISTVKIEGRMKGAAYVTAATRLYRAAVDRAWKELLEQQGSVSDPVQLERLAWEARQVYSRGASEGFLGGVNHQVLVDGRTRSHRGIEVGRVAPFESPSRMPSTRDSLVIDLEPQMRLSAGDGLLFSVTPLEEDEEGGRIQEVEALSSRRVRVRFARESSPNVQRVPPGTPVFRTAHPELLGALRDRMRHPEKPVLVSMRVFGSLGTSLEVRATDPEGRAVSARSQAMLSKAEKNPLAEPRLREQLGRLGDTRYRLGSLEIALDGELFLPVSELNQIRRELVVSLERIRSVPIARGEHEPATHLAHESESEPDAHGDSSPIAWAVLRAESEDGKSSPSQHGRSTQLDPARRDTEESSSRTTRSSSPETSNLFEDQVLVLCRNRAHLESVLDAGVRWVGLDFLDLVGLKEATARARDAGARIALALPRIQKPGEEKIESYFLAREPDEILVRSLASLERLHTVKRAESRSGSMHPDRSGPALVGDVSLNGVNPASISTLLEMGLDRITPGLDLNGEQLQNLIRSVDATRIEIPIHHHLPVFHTEHCVFAAFLSDGADFRSCGRPCDRHQIALRDRTGQQHPVIADVGCRNTVFGARPQSALPYLSSLRKLGVSRFRIELVSESASEIARILDLYRQVWNGTRRVESALAELKAEGRYGVSTGSPEPPRRPARQA